MKQKDFLYHISTSRVLVFVEIESNTNKYHQIYLTRNQYKDLTSVIGVLTDQKDEYGDSIMQTVESEDIYDLPDLRHVNE